MCCRPAGRCADPGRFARAGPRRARSGVDFRRPRIDTQGFRRRVVTGHTGRPSLPLPPVVRPGLKGNEAARKPPRFLFSASVWPSGDWLPFRYVERATQIHGGFGLAGQIFPGEWVTKRQGRWRAGIGAKAQAARRRPRRRSGRRRRPGGRSRRGVRGSGGSAPSRAARCRRVVRGSASSTRKWVTAARATVAARGDDRSPRPVAAERRVDRAALGVRMTRDEREVLAPAPRGPGSSAAARGAPPRSGRPASGRRCPGRAGGRCPPRSGSGPPAAVPPERLGERPRGVPRAGVDDHPGGLVDHEQVLVLVDDLEGRRRRLAASRPAPPRRSTRSPGWTRWLFGRGRPSTVTRPSSTRRAAAARESAGPARDDDVQPLAHLRPGGPSTT